MVEYSHEKNVVGISELSKNMWHTRSRYSRIVTVIIWTPEQLPKKKTHTFGRTKNVMFYC